MTQYVGTKCVYQKLTSSEALSSEAVHQKLTSSEVLKIIRSWKIESFKIMSNAVLIMPIIAEGKKHGTSSNTVVEYYVVLSYLLVFFMHFFTYFLCHIP